MIYYYRLSYTAVYTMTRISSNFTSCNFEIIECNSVIYKILS